MWNESEPLLPVITYVPNMIHLHFGYSRSLLGTLDTVICFLLRYRHNYCALLREKTLIIIVRGRHNLLREKKNYDNAHFDVSSVNLMLFANDLGYLCMIMVDK